MVDLKIKFFLQCKKRDGGKEGWKMPPHSKIYAGKHLNIIIVSRVLVMYMLYETLPI